MTRRWAAWLAVATVLVAMSVIRLADRKERIPRECPNAAKRESSNPGPVYGASGGGP